MLLLLLLNNSIVCFHYHLHFLRCLQRSQAQQQKFCTCEKTNLSPVCLLSDVNREQHDLWSGTPWLLSPVSVWDWSSNLGKDGLWRHWC